MKKLTGMYFRWLSEIQSYDFIVRHRPGKQNSNADGMSRSNHLDPPTKEEEEEEEGYIHRLHQWVNGLEKENGQLRSLTSVNRQLSKEKIIKEQMDDHVVSTVRKWVKEGKAPNKVNIREQPEELKIYHQIFYTLILRGDVLYRIKEGRMGQKQYQICVPEKLKEGSHYWAHQHITAGHFGIRATGLRLATRFYYPGMKNDSEVRVRPCPDCLAKIQRAKVRDATHHPRRTGYVGELLFVDLVGPMPITREQKKYILTLEDAFSRYAMAIPLHLSLIHI